MYPLLNANINDSIHLLSLSCIIGEFVLCTVVSHVSFNEGLSMNWESSVPACQLTVKKGNARENAKARAAEFWLGSLSFVGYKPLTTNPIISFVNMLA